MSHQIAIIADLDRLPKAYDLNDTTAKPTKAIFSLTLSCGIYADKAQNSYQTILNGIPNNWQWALPWRWTKTAPRITNVMVWTVKGNTATLLPGTGANQSWDVMPLAAPPTPLNTDAVYTNDAATLKDHYEAVFARSLESAANSDAATYLRQEVLATDQAAFELSLLCNAQETSGFNLSGQIGHASTALAPLNHYLNLTCLVTLPLDKLNTLAEKLIVFPLLADSWGSPGPNPAQNSWDWFPSQVQDPRPAVPAANYPWWIPYSTVQPNAPAAANGWRPPQVRVATDVVGSTRSWANPDYVPPGPPPVAPAPPAALIGTSAQRMDLSQSLQVNLTLDGWDSENWLPRLETDVAALFDLSQRIVDGGRIAVKNDITFSNKQFWKWVSKSSRDMAFLGLLPAANNSSFMQLILDFAKSLNPKDNVFDPRADDFVAAIGLYTANGPRPDEWYDYVYVQLGGTDKSQTATKLPQDGGNIDAMTPRELVAFADRFVAILRSAETTRTLLLDQWSKVFDNLTEATWTGPTNESLVPKLTAFVSSTLELMKDPAKELARGFVNDKDSSGVPRWAVLLHDTPTTPPTNDDPRGRMRNRLLAIFKDYFDSRIHSIDNTALPLPTTVPNPVTSLVDCISQVIVNDAKDIVPDGVQPQKGIKPPKEKKPLRQTPHGITLHIDQPDHLAHADNDQATDYLSRLSGFYIFARKINPATGAYDTSRSLNYTRISLEQTTLCDKTTPGSNPPDPKIDSSAQWMETTAKTLTGVYLVPSRPAYTNNQRESSLTYDNHPLVAESPANDLVKNNKIVPASVNTGEDLTGLNDKDSQRDTWLHYPDSRLGRVSYVTDFTEAEVKSDYGIPGLAYSIKHQFAGSAAMNAGILPNKLYSGHPALPVKVSSTDAFFTDDATKIVELVYKRLVPPSSIRLVPVAYSSPKDPPLLESTDDLPTIPDFKKNCLSKVKRPLAWELLDSAYADEAASITQAADGKTDIPTRPILIVLDGEKALGTTLNFRKPLSTTENWLRWVAANPALSLEDRSWELGYFSHIKDAPTVTIDGKEVRQPEDPPDDPASADIFWVEAEQLYPPPPNPVLPNSPPRFVAGIVDWNPKPLSQPVYNLNRCDSAAINVSVVASPDMSAWPKSVRNGPPKFTDLFPTTFQVAKGSIWRFKKYVLVETSIYEKYFDTPSFTSREVAANTTNPDDWQYLDYNAAGPGAKHAYVRFRPTEFVTEVATKDLPSADSLYNSTQPRAVGNLVSVDLLCPENSDSAKYAYIGRVEVPYQVWNWSGWPVDPFPFDTSFKVPADQDVLRKLDTSYFYNREDSKRANSDSTVGWRSNAPGNVLATVFRIDHAGDPRALYYRFGLVAVSRYEGLYANCLRMAAIPYPRVTPEIGDIWSRCVLPARPRQKLSRPSVNFILPLYGAPGTKNKSSVLVILDDLWFQEYGMAEQLEAAVSIGKNYVTSTNFQKFPDAGFEPIVSLRALNAYTGPNDVEGLPVASLIGPVGLTHDLNISQPLLSSTCFILDQLPDDLVYPDPKGNPVKLDGKEIPAWFWLRLQFRRSLLSYSAGVDNAGEKIDVSGCASDWTHPLWVQFVPPADALLPLNWNASDDYELSGTTSYLLKNKTPNQPLPKPEYWIDPGLSIDPQTGQPANPVEFHPGFFDYWWVLTQVVVGSDGLQREIYKDTFLIDGTGLRVRLSQAQLDTSASYRLRIMQLRLSARNLKPDAQAIVKAFRDRVDSSIKNSHSPYENIFGDPASDSDRVREDASAQIMGLSPPLTVQITP